MNNKDNKKQMKKENVPPNDRRSFMNGYYESRRVEQDFMEKMMEKKSAYYVHRIVKNPFEGLNENYQFVKGLNFLKEMDLPQAYRYYRKMVKEHPKKEELWSNLGAAHMADKNRQYALKCYDEALELNPNYYIALYNKGGVYYECKKYEKAVEFFNKALDVNPECAEAYNDREIAREKLGIMSFSLESMKESLNRMMLGNSLRAMLNKSSALVDLGNGKDAIMGYYERFYKNDEKIEELFRQAQQMEEAGNDKKAFELYNKALQVNPMEPITITRKASLLAKEGLMGDALYNAEKAVRIDPKLLDGWFLKGTVLATMKRLREAIEAYEKALKINPFHTPTLLAKRTLEMFTR